ncbi:hypothetical protein N9Y60_03480 [Crocinitomicaceae bacterium]|nr:hypothetical protein [Crocinitomicaceae bacterium]
MSDMIDPVSAIGLASAAYRGIKAAVSTGKELHDMAGTLSQWAGAMSDLDFSHKQAENPPMFKKMFGASKIEANALEIWGHKEKAKELREDLRSHISLYYGPSAWEEIVRIEGQMRKKRKEEVYAAEERKQLIIEWTVGIVMAVALASVLAGIVYITGAGTGKW